MKYTKLIKYDLKRGFSYNYKKYIFIFFIVFLNCIFTINSIQKFRFITSIEGTFIDYILYFFKGMEMFMPNSNDEYVLPVAWFFIQIMTAYIVAYYTIDDLDGYGQNILIRYKKRTKWWISKCIWNILSVISVYLVAYLGIFIACLIRKVEIGMIISKEFARSVSLIEFTNTPNSEILIALILLPLCVSITLSIMQMSLSIYINPMLSFIFNMLLLFLSTLFTKEWLIGNYSMIMRNTIVIDYGVKTRNGFIVCLVIIIVAFLLGAYGINRYDILNVKE